MVMEHFCQAARVQYAISPGLDLLLGGGKADFVPFLLGYSKKYRQAALHFDGGVWGNLSKHRPDFVAFDGHGFVDHDLRLFLQSVARIRSAASINCSSEESWLSAWATSFDWWRHLAKKSGSRVSGTHI